MLVLVCLLLVCPGISECWGRYALGLVGAGVCVPQGWWMPCHAMQWVTWCHSGVGGAAGQERLCGCPPATL